MTTFGVTFALGGRRAYFLFRASIFTIELCIRNSSAGPQPRLVLRILFRFAKRIFCT
jgi:hypothetical protein